MTTSTYQKQEQSALTLSNAGEIISGVVREIAGNDISNTINGSKISNEIIVSLAFQRIQKDLEAVIAPTGV